MHIFVLMRQFFLTLDTIKFYAQFVQIFIIISELWMLLHSLRDLSIKYQSHPKKKKIDAFKQKLDVDPQRDDDASPMSSYGCMLRPTWMFMNRMIAPINVHSMS